MRGLLLGFGLAVATACSGGGRAPAASGSASGASGSAVPSTTPGVRMPSAANVSPVQDLLTAPELAPYWHPDQPGRVPVRLVENPNSTDRPVFPLHGADVVWIAASAATPGSAYVEVTFQLVDGLLELTARYPIEGVTARATYVPLQPSGWSRTGAVRVTEQ
jgi:hypothetical protein